MGPLWRFGIVCKKLVVKIIEKERDKTPPGGEKRETGGGAGVGVSGESSGGGGEVGGCG